MSIYWISNKQLAGYIEQGLQLPGVKECAGAYFQQTKTSHLVCALGLAWLGKTCNVHESIRLFHERCRNLPPPFALGRLIGINSNLALAIDAVHSPKAGRSAAKIVERLRQGKPLLILEAY